MSAPYFVADFDSASAMLRATARYLHGKDFAKLGMGHPLQSLIPVANALPEAIREQIYIWSGWSEAIPEDRLGDVDIEEAARWAVGEYPERRYPAIAVGSSNGAAVHLWSALGVPWLPQTVLVPVRRSGVHPDEPMDDMEWGREPGRRLLENNPDLQLHHMHDPNQDRLMVQQMTYFRVKRRRLGPAYTDFIERSLERDGTIFLVECERKWPVVRIDDRHFFQPGAMGGAKPEEYVGDSPRVAEYLDRYDSHRRQWQHAEPDEEQPEAEWGFVDDLREDVARLAAARGYRVRRLRFTEPEDLSPLVADLYRWWYRQRGYPGNRLLSESFILMEPWWALRTGSVPWWAKFGTQPSAEKLEQYLDSSEPFDELYMMLFSHGVEGVGVADIDRWRGILARARRAGAFVGVDEKEYPRDFATLVRYHDDLPQTISARYPMPGPLALSELDRFMNEPTATRHAVTIEDLELAVAGRAG
jgi:hypothetical protein